MYPKKSQDKEIIVENGHLHLIPLTINSINGIFNFLKGKAQPSVY